MAQISPGDVAVVTIPGHLTIVAFQLALSLAHWDRSLRDYVSQWPTVDSDGLCCLLSSEFGDAELEQLFSDSLRWLEADKKRRGHQDRRHFGDWLYPTPPQQPIYPISDACPAKASHFHESLTAALIERGATSAVIHIDGREKHDNPFTGLLRAVAASANCVLFLVSTTRRKSDRITVATSPGGVICDTTWGYWRNFL